MSSWAERTSYPARGLLYQMFLLTLAAEAMNERERAKLSIVRCTRAPTVQGRAHGSNEDAQHGAGDVRVRLEEGAQPLRHAQHPLPDGKLREHMLGDVGGDFCHTARIA